MAYTDPKDPRRYAASKKWYENNKRKHQDNVNRNKREARAKWHAYKKTLKCINCGENHPATLDFHHFDRSNPLNRKVYKLINNGNYRAVMEEITLRCVVLCSNCHRKHHAAEHKHKKKLDTQAHDTHNTHKDVPTTPKESDMALSDILNIFKGKESKKEEAAEKKATPSVYAKGEKKEGVKSTSAKKPMRSATAPAKKTVAKKTVAKKKK